MLPKLPILNMSFNSSRSHLILDFPVYTMGKIIAPLTASRGVENQ